MVDPVSFGPVNPVRGRVERLGHEQISRKPQTISMQSAPALPTLVRLAQDLAKEGPPVDTARIAEIRDAIATGQYRPDAERIAIAIQAWYGGHSR
jgi:flagellar biosynthesis anti-sigma factor FlgM